MLKKEDFDFYYLIICSRGPGSETITVDDVNAAKGEIEFTDAAETEFKMFGVCGAEASFNDEGPLLAVPAGTKPLKGIYQWLVYDNEKWKNERCEVGKVLDVPGEDVRLINITTRINDIANEMEQAYISACFRAFLPAKIGSNGNPWTSVNGWREVEIEITNQFQFEALMEATGLTSAELSTWNCAVVQKASALYLKKKLPTREFSGC